MAQKRGGSLTADLEQETKINPEPEMNHDLDEEEELPLPYNFDIEPICSGEDIKFGDLPDFLDLKGFDEYLPDLKGLGFLFGFFIFFLFCVHTYTNIVSAKTFLLKRVVSLFTNMNLSHSVSMRLDMRSAHLSQPL